MRALLFQSAGQNERKNGRGKGQNGKKPCNRYAFAKAACAFGALKQLRLTLAREENLPPYIIFSDKTLIDMCHKMPHTQQEMLDVNGVGENKFARYGEAFIRCITQNS